MRFPSSLKLPLVAALGVACADPSGGALLPAEGFVIADDNFFDPINVSIRVGGTVTWTMGGGPHNVQFFAPAAPLDCQDTTGGDTCVRTFPARGTFDYSCSHHDAMVGQVRVD